MNKLDENSLNMSGYSIDEIYIGMTRSVSKTISESDIYTFAGLIGDINPVHINAEYAKNTRFSTLVGMLIPGADAIYLGQTCEFLLPVKIGDTITATGEVIKIIPEKRIAHMRTKVLNQRGELVVDGQAKVMATKATQ